MSTVRDRSCVSNDSQVSVVRTRLVVTLFICSMPIVHIKSMDLEPSKNEHYLFSDVDESL